MQEGTVGAATQMDASMHLFFASVDIPMMQCSGSPTSQNRFFLYGSLPHQTLTENVKPKGTSIGDVGSCIACMFGGARHCGNNNLTAAIALPLFTYNACLPF